jgi:hypothetical protein
MAIDELSSRPDHEHPSELPGVSLDAGLARAGSQGTQGVARKPGGEHLDPPTAQACGPIGAKLRIHQDGPIESIILTEGLSEARGTVADDHELGSAGADLVYAVAQLRDLLTAEHSAEVSDEDEDDRAVLPERSETDALSVDIFELDGRESGRDAHGNSS